MRAWCLVRSETLFAHRLLELQRCDLAAGDDRRQAIVLKLPDWVNVVALTEDGEVSFVRQWRYGLARPTLEIPGGVVEPGEDELVAAQRELLEETGFKGRTWSRLGEVHPNPAIQSNRTSTWLVTDLERISDPEGDGEEELEVLRVPLEQVRRLIREGEVTHSLVVAAFYLLMCRKELGTLSA